MNDSKEVCIQCGKNSCVKDTFLCSKCFEDESMFYNPRFELINDKKLLNPINLEKFNNAPYYIKRFFIQELITLGKMI